MADIKISALTEDIAPTFDDLVATVNDPAGTPATKKAKLVNVTGSPVNAQTGTSYTILTSDYRKLITHTNGSAIAVTLPQAGASFPANWFCFVQNRGAGAVTITPTTSTIDGAATLVLNQNEGAIIYSDGTNYFTFRGKQAGGATPAAHAASHAIGGGDALEQDATLNDQTGTTYTIQASDNGKVITCSNAAAITVTVPSGLGVGFNCLVIQKGAGQVTFSPSSTTVNNRQSHTKIAGQYGVVSLVAYASDVFVLGGDTAS
jgi:hypothetical protein